MDTGPRIDSYEWSGGREAMLRFGPEGGPVVVLALPLFEEANRCRAFGVTLLRALAARGIGGVLPDLPGQGESELPTAAPTLADLRAAYAAAPGGYALAIRSGALLVGDRWPCWMLAPQDGSTLLRELQRTKGAPLDGEHVEVAGNLLSSRLIDELAASPGIAGEGAGFRTVRLRSDGRPADLHVDGSPLWRRAEPDNDPALAETLADDITAWIAGDTTGLKASPAKAGAQSR